MDFATQTSTPDVAGCTEDDIPPDSRATLDRASRQQTMAVTTYITGGTLVAVGLALMYAAPGYRAKIHPRQTQCQTQ